MVAQVLADAGQRMTHLDAEAAQALDSGDRDAGIAAPIRSMALASSEVLEGGVVWLRYRLQNG